MPIKKDHSALPFPTKSDGIPPVERPFVVPVLAERWLQKYTEAGNTEKAMSLPGRRFRASWAASRCDRSLAYKMQNVDPSEPATLADYWRFGLGQMVHDYLQDVFVGLFPNARVEVAVDLRTIGLDGAASVDIVIDPTTADSRTIVVEVKTINGFGFKKSATAFKGPAEGPRFSAVVQGSLAAAALDADLVIAYLSLENLSPSMALSYGDGTTVGQFAAEWHIDADQAKTIADAEVTRINNVIDMIDADILPPRTIHDPEVAPGGTVTDPNRGAWQVQQGGNVVATGRTWMCDYCDHRSRCISDGEGGAAHSEEF